jgi:AMP deaminase
MQKSSSKLLSIYSIQVTNDPGSHPELHRFLQHVSGLDSVDDESKHENVPFTVDSPEPADYTEEKVV